MGRSQKQTPAGCVLSYNPGSASKLLCDLGLCLVEISERRPVWVVNPAETRLQVPLALSVAVLLTELH